MQVQNPILRGWHPDPCFCSARGKYYLATSTFQWVPGVSLYESDDLVVWKSVGGALPDLDLRGIPDSAGVWAPDLTYDEESGLFWLVYTIAKQIDGIFKDVENYVVTAPAIEGPWSCPRFINASGFDPGMFHENGHHYVLNPQWDPRPLEGHHRFNGLVMQEFSLEEGLIGPARKVLGNEDAVNWLREGPHILKADGWYYIACAEGGTGRRHRIRMVRSRELWGPYEVAPEPLVCSWLAQTPLRKAGHGNFVQMSDGSWFVCHLTSRYVAGEDGSCATFDESESGLSPLGRETALQRVEWIDGWPHLAGGGRVPSVFVDVPSASASARVSAGHAGYRYETTFLRDTDLWREEWFAPRHIDAERLQFAAQGLKLAVGDSPSSLFDRTGIERRVTSFDWHAEAAFAVTPEHYNQSAGLICEYDSRAFVYSHVTWDEEHACRVIDVLVNDNGSFEMPLGVTDRIVVPDDVKNVTLGFDVRAGRALGLSYAFDGDAAQRITAGGVPLKLNATHMSDEHVEGWAYTGTMVGIACVDMWDKSVSATFSHFAYEDLASGEVLG